MENSLTSMSFYEKCGKDDAKVWVTGLYNTGLPETVTVEDARRAGMTFFNKAFGDGGNYVRIYFDNEESFYECKEAYESSFVQNAILEIKDKRSAKAVNSKAQKDKKEQYTKEGKETAARWFITISDASFFKTVDEEDISKVSKFCFALKHPEEDDAELKQAFIMAFIREANSLFNING